MVNADTHLHVSPKETLVHKSDDSIAELRDCENRKSCFCNHICLNTENLSICGQELVAAYVLRNIFQDEISLYEALLLRFDEFDLMLLSDQDKKTISVLKGHIDQRQVCSALFGEGNCFLWQLDSRSIHFSEQTVRSCAFFYSDNPKELDRIERCFETIRISFHKSNGYKIEL